MALRANLAASVEEGTRGQGDTVTRGCAAASSRPLTFRSPVSPPFQYASGRVGTACQPSYICEIRVSGCGYRVSVGTASGRDSTTCCPISRAPPAGRGEASPRPPDNNKGAAKPRPYHIMPLGQHAVLSLPQTMPAQRSRSDRHLFNESTNQRTLHPQPSTPPSALDPALCTLILISPLPTCPHVTLSPRGLQSRSPLHFAQASGRFAPLHGL